MSQPVDLKPITLGFKTAAQLTGMSKRYLEGASRESDPTKRLRTVRISSRRLIRFPDLVDWVSRVSRAEEEQTD